MPKKQDRGQVKWLFSQENAVKHSRMQEGISQMQQVPQNSWLVTKGDPAPAGSVPLTEFSQREMNSYVSYGTDNSQYYIAM